MGCGGSVSKAERHAGIKKYRSEVLKAMEQQYAESEKLVNNPCLTHTLSVLAELPAPVIVWQMDGTVLLANVASLQLLQRDVERFIGGCHLSKMVIIPLELHKDYTQLTFQELTGAGILESGERIQVSLSTSIVEVSDTSNIYIGTLRECGDVSATISPPAAQTSPMLDMTHFLGTDQFGSSLTSPTHKLKVHFSRALVSDELLVVIDCMKFAAILTTTKGQILHWNSACEAMFGPTAEEATGHMMDILIPEPFASYHNQLLEEMAPKGEKIPKHERLSSVKKGEFLRTSREVIGTRVDSPTQVAARERGEQVLLPALVYLRLRVTEISTTAGTMWLVVMEETPPTSAHSILAGQCIQSAGVPPAMLPKEAPPFPASLTRPCRQLSQTISRTPVEVTPTRTPTRAPSTMFIQIPVTESIDCGRSPDFPKRGNNIDC
eukprot:Hpha_TRINITY_DN16814_c5_g8::TRINITY_DN16814_c5_g8_i1::g.151608::m.151608